MQMLGLYCASCPRHLTEKHVPEDSWGLPQLRISQPEYEAVVDEVLVPGKKWRVRYRASFWQACSPQVHVQFQPQQVVRVIGRQNLTLIILPM